jgi:hypothetical protein
VIVSAAHESLRSEIFRREASRMPVSIWLIFNDVPSIEPGRIRYS